MFLSCIADSNSPPRTIYREDHMENFRDIERALEHRLKGTCAHLKLNVVKAAQRLVVERIVDRDNWERAFGKAPVMLTGGCLVAQQHRQTTDADIRAVRRYTEQELVDGLISLNAVLEPAGMRILSARVRKLDVGLKHPVDRLEFQATCGGVRANSRVDIAYGWGPDAWPRGVEEFDFTSLSAKFPTYKALAQPLEAAVAEKWIAAIMQPETDLRAKYLVDLAFFYKNYDDLDDARIAAEMARIQRHSGIEWKQVALRRDDAISYERIMAMAEDWAKVCKDKGLNIDPFDGFLELGLAYRRFAPHRVQHLFAHYRQRAKVRDALIAEGRFPEHLPPAPTWDNVVSFKR
jgi:hypothetical protein